jgi:hypothetical protein
MADYIEIPDLLLREIGEELVALSGPVGSKGHGDVPKELISILVDYLGEDLGCDHSVGICCCGTAALVAELRLALDGKQSCRACGGDGTGWDQALYESRRGGYSADFAGMVKCPDCDGTGITE